MSLTTLFDDAAQFFKDRDSFTLVSHADADGICASAILQETLEEQNKRCIVHFLDQVSTIALERLAKEVEGAAVFVDMGSAHLGIIEANFGKDILVIDHHQCPQTPTHALVVNPTLHGMDGTKEACAASLAFEIASRMNAALEIGAWALIGAQADHQLPFIGLNASIFDELASAGLARKRDGARLFGIQTKSLVHLLTTSYDLKIKVLERNPRGAIHILRELGIDPGTRDLERFYTDLSEEEQNRLDEHLIKLSPNPNARITHYLLDGDGTLSDTREAATLINACGRAMMPSLGVRVLREHNASLAQEADKAYRTSVQKAHAWFERAQRTDAIIEHGDMLILLAKSSIAPQVAGSLCSSLVRGRNVPEGTSVVCLARNADGSTKVSARHLNSPRDLAVLITRAAAAVGGEGGGHAVAAGAIIPTEQEEAFIEELLK